MEMTESLTTSVELALVGGVLVRGETELALVRSDVTPTEWGDARARAVMDAACEAVDRGLGLGTVHIAAALERRGALDMVGGLAALDALRMRDRGAGERETLVRRVRDHARVRQAAIVAAKLAKAGASPAALENPDRYLAAVATMADSARAPLRSGSISAAKAAEMTYREFQARGEKSPAIRTPIPALNEYLEGGWWPGRNYIIGARPAVGKTALAVTSMVYAAQSGHPQFMFSREMKVTDLTGRAVVQMADIDNARWQRGPKAFTTSEFRSIIGALTRYGQAPIEVNVDENESGAMLARLRVWLDVVVEPMREAKPDLIPMCWVDYLQVCKKAGKFESRREMLGEMMEQFAEFGRKHNVAMGIVAACNRSSKKEQRPPRIDDLAECGAVEYHANAVILPHRDAGAIHDDAKDGDGESVERGQLVHQDGIIILDKNRDGAPGVIPVTWHRTRGKWTERLTHWTADAGAYAEH